jgi:hypothetical protein
MDELREGPLSEEEAARLWGRAAQLQAEAIRRSEALDSELASNELATREGYDLEHVRTAAVEAGIGAEHFDAALADLRASKAVKVTGGKLTRLVLGNPADTITVRREIRASPARILQTMEEILPHEPYRLTLTDREGDPLDGGLLVFRIEGVGFTVTDGFRGQASAADLRQVLVTIRPLPGRDPETAEVVLRGPVAWAHRLNAMIGSVLIGMGSAVGLGLSSVAGSVAAALLAGSGLVMWPVTGVVAAVIAAGGTGLGGVGSVAGFRKLYAWSLGKGRDGLDGLLGEIAVRAQGGWGLTPEEKGSRGP